MSVSRKAVEQRQKAGKRVAQIKNVIIDYYMVKRHDHDNNNNNES